MADTWDLKSHEHYVRPGSNPGITILCFIQLTILKDYFNVLSDW